jgi:hypothetical protein
VILFHLYSTLEKKSIYFTITGKRSFALVDKKNSKKIKSLICECMHGKTPEKGIQNVNLFLG